MSFKIKSITLDAISKGSKFKPSSNAEREFYRSLKKVAQNAGHIVESHAEGANLRDQKKMQKALDDYAKLIEPWATVQATKLLENVQKSNRRAYERHSKIMNKMMKENVAKSKTGQAALALLNEQVVLITSIPREAGLRAQKIAYDNFINGSRAEPDPQIVRQLKIDMDMSTKAAVNRAKLIARTETAKANQAFVQVRAEAIGVNRYIWRTTMDGAERDSHAEMNGREVEWDNPPVLSDGTQGHAGTFPNCRCWQDPVLPDDD